MASGGGWTKGMTSDMAVYNCAVKQYGLLSAAYINLLQEIRTKHAGDPATQLWLFQIELFPELLQGQQYRITEFGAAENVASDLRQLLTGAQSAYNWLTSHTSKGGVAPGSTKAAQELQKDLSELANLKKEFPSLAGIIGTQAMNNIIAQASNLMQNFSNGNGGHNNISAGNIIQDIKAWVQAAGTQAKPASGTSLVPAPTVSPIIQDMNGIFANLNQTLSGTSTELQTKIQTYAQNLQQFIGAYKSTYDTYSQYVNAILNNFPKN